MGKLSAVFAVLALAGVTSTSWGALGVGDTAPNITLNTWGTTTPVNLYDYSGKIVILDFFAYWCGPCMTASSELETNIQEYYATNNGNPNHIPVVLISLSIDNSNPTAVNNWISNYGLHTVLDDANQTAFTPYSNGGIPQIEIINGVAGANVPQWQIIGSQLGYSSGLYSSFRSTIDSITVVPEPATAGLLGAAAAVVLVKRRKRG